MKCYNDQVISRLIEKYFVIYLNKKYDFKHVY